MNVQSVWFLVLDPILIIEKSGLHLSYQFIYVAYNQLIRAVLYKRIKLFSLTYPTLTNKIVEIRLVLSVNSKYSNINFTTKVSKIVQIQTYFLIQGKHFLWYQSA